SEPSVVSTNRRDEGIGLIQGNRFGQVDTRMDVPAIVAATSGSIEPSEVEGALTVVLVPASVDLETQSHIIEFMPAIGGNDIAIDLGAGSSTTQVGITVETGVGVGVGKAELGFPDITFDTSR